MAACFILVALPFAFAYTDKHSTATRATLASLTRSTLHCSRRRRRHGGVLGPYGQDEQGHVSSVPGGVRERVLQERPRRVLSKHVDQKRSGLQRVHERSCWRLGFWRHLLILYEAQSFQGGTNGWRRQPLLWVRRPGGRHVD